jgi:glycosyltransferase involved in cell wall biosynthesis
VEVIGERYRYDLGVIPQLRGAVKSWRPDIIQSHNVKSNLLVRLLGLWREYPWIVFQHGYTATNFKDTVYNQIDRWSVLKANRVVCVCGAFAKRVEGWGVPANQILVQHNSVKPLAPVRSEAVKRLRESYGLDAGTAVILAVGRLSREKGHSDLVRAIALLRAREPEMPIRLLVAGEGPERPAIERLRRTLGLEKTVVLAGQQADIAPFYAAADVLALSSHTEGSPNVVLEAMTAGVPVVATAVGGVPEIIEHERTGLLAPRKDPEAIADALARLLRDAELRRRLSATARELVTTRHSDAAYRCALVSLYRDVLRHA